MLIVFLFFVFGLLDNMVPYKNTTTANATASSINQALHLCYIMWDVMCGLVMPFK